MARGCSLDGSIIYGTAWEGLDSGLIWWDREGTPRWVGDKVRKLKSVKIYDTEKYVECAGFRKVASDKVAYAKACRIQMDNQDVVSGQIMTYAPKAASMKE